MGGVVVERGTIGQDSQCCISFFPREGFVVLVANLTLQAWSSVVHTLIPNVNLISSHLTYLRDLCLAVELVAFETETFLVIAKSGTPVDTPVDELDHAEKKGGVDKLGVKRFEKISEIVKGFRKTCQ